MIAYSHFSSTHIKSLARKSKELLFASFAFSHLKIIHGLNMKLYCVSRVQQCIVFSELWSGSARTQISYYQRLVINILFRDADKKKNERNFFSSLLDVITNAFCQKLSTNTVAGAKRSSTNNAHTSSTLFELFHWLDSQELVSAD